MQYRKQFSDFLDTPLGRSFGVSVALLCELCFVLNNRPCITPAVIESEILLLKQMGKSIQDFPVVNGTFEIRTYEDVKITQTNSLVVSVDYLLPMVCSFWMAVQDSDICNMGTTICRPSTYWCCCQ